MQKSLRKARNLVLAGVAAGSLTFLTASPAGAVGARPVDPTSMPEPTVPLRPPQPRPGTPGPAIPPAPPQPAPVPAPARLPGCKVQPVEPMEYCWWY